MSKKLLIDSFGTPIRMSLTEDAGGSWIMEGEYGKADVPTENRRIYPRAIWEREIARIQPAITEGKVLGELDHPADGKTSLKRVSHVLLNLSMNPDGRIVGRSRIMKNEHGAQLKSILDAGGAVGVSSRGMGSTAMNEDGYEVVQEDFSYMTHDCVADPAVKTSYPKFTTESKQESKPAVLEVTQPNKETVMEDQKQKEAAAQAEGKEKQVVESTVPATEVKTEQKTESVTPAAQAADPAKELGEDVKKLLADQKKELEEGFQKSLDAKLAEAKADPAALAGKIVLEDIAAKLRPFLLPEDVQELVKGKEKEIEDLKKIVEGNGKEISGLKEKCQKFGESAKNSLMLLHFERAVAESTDRVAIRKLVGDPRRFSDHKGLLEAVDGAKKALAAVVEDKKGTEKKVKEVTESFEKKQSELEAKVKRLETSLNESTSLAKKMGIKAYVLEKTKGNPNAPKIEKLAESLETKEAVDKLLEKFSVETPAPKEYNSIRARLEHKLGAQKDSLVESQLRETGLKEDGGSKETVAEGVEAEMENLFPGADLDQVKGLAGN